MFLAAQIVSIVTIISTIIGLCCKNKYNIMLFMTLSNISMFATYLLLGRHLGCLLVGGGILRTLIYFLYAKFNKKPQLVFVIFFEIYVVLLSLFLWKDFTDLFMIANLCLITYTTWQDNMAVFRIGYIASSVFLITYDISVGAYVGCVSEVIMLLVSVWALVKYDYINRIKDIVEHFYSTIAPTYEMQFKQNGNAKYIICHNINDEYNNFCYLKSPKDAEENLQEIKKTFELEGRRPAVYFQSVANENINEIVAFSKTHKLLFHDCWMKLKTGYRNKTKKCQLKGVSFRLADERDAKDLLYVFKAGFVDCSGNDVYKYSNDYYVQYKKVMENKALKEHNIYPYIGYYENQPICVLFIYVNGTNAYLCQITTLEKFRRNGVASNLINYSIQNQRKRGIENFYLVTEKYTFLETFYLKNNFEEVSQGFCFDIKKKPRLSHGDEKEAIKAPIKKPKSKNHTAA